MSSRAEAKAKELGGTVVVEPFDQRGELRNA